MRSRLVYDVTWVDELTTCLPCLRYVQPFFPLIVAYLGGERSALYGWAPRNQSFARELAVRRIGSFRFCF